MKNNKGRDNKGRFVKGFRHTEKSKVLIRKAALTLPTFFKKGNKINLGRSYSESHKNNIRITKLGKKNPMFGKHHTESWKKEMSLKFKGPLSPRWNGGPKNLHQIRCSYRCKNWERKVFKRDKFRCRITGKSGRLSAHHIKSFTNYPSLRFLVSNGFTMLKILHDRFHKIYGRGNTSKKQLLQFIKLIKKEG